MEENKRHSLLGLFSCITGCSTFFIFLLAAVFYYLQFQGITTRPRDEGLGILQMIAVMFVPIPVHIVCLILGAAPLFFASRKKIFPILGVALNLIFALISLFPWLWLIIGGTGRV